MDDAERFSPPVSQPPLHGRRRALAALGLLLLLAPALAACKEVKPGSGVETLSHKQRHDGGPGGK
jgi:hypothetical protein